MNLYMINNTYLKYLHNIDYRVSEEDKPTRKFIGVVLMINEVRYYAPLSSPKEKHKYIRDRALDIFKIHNNELGVINLNNMVPVPECALIRFNINDEDEDYRNLLKKQMVFIRNKKEAIIKKAEKLYKIVKSGKQPKLNSRCCDYIMLEKYYNNFELAEVAATE